MELIVQLLPMGGMTERRPPDAREALQPSPPRFDRQEVDRVAAEHGVRLEWQHPGTQDPELASFLFGVVADDVTGERLAQELRQLPGVDAAFLKPSPELP